MAIKVDSKDVNKDNAVLIYSNIIRKYGLGIESVLEIGSGWSTKIFSDSVNQAYGHIWTIDIIGKDVEGLRNVTIIRGDSLKIKWDRLVDLLYIDGYHDQKHVMNELKRFAKYVKPGRFILLDDLRHKPTYGPAYNTGIYYELQDYCEKHHLKFFWCAPEPNKIGGFLVNDVLP